MQIEPAGQVKEGLGHHDILINQTSWPEGEIIPPSDTTIHFGKGQTETELTIEPGNYVISLQQKSISAEQLASATRRLRHLRSIAAHLSDPPKVR